MFPHHRYYDPATGQFLSVDPLVDVTGQPYAYTGGDPVNSSDQAGLSGNGVDLICSGGGTLPKGETRAQACAGTQQRAKQVTASEYANQGGPNRPIYDWYSHTVIGFGGCYIVCINASFQGGAFSVSVGGVGFLLKGPYVGYSNSCVCPRSPQQQWQSLAYEVGGTFSQGVTNGVTNPRDWEVDAGVGAGAGAGRMWDIATAAPFGVSCGS